MRLPLATTIQSRDGLTTKDAKLVNALVEPKGDQAWVRKRPGLTSLGLIKVGTAQLLYCWNGIKAIIGDYFNAGYIGEYANLTTLNSADKGTNVTLSGGDLTFSTNGASNGFVRSVATRTTGYLYFEVTATTAGVMNVGMSNTSASVNSIIGASNNGIEYYASGDILKNGVSLASGAAINNGDIVGVLYDATAGTIAFYKNNALQYTATGSNVPTGTIYPSVGSRLGTCTGTVNFGATAFTYPPGGITSSNLSPSTAGLQFSAQDNGANAATDLLMIKNATQAWTVNGSGTITQITDTDYPGTYQVGVSSLTRSGTTATAVTTIDTNFQVGGSVTVAGATPSAYNGTFTITGVSRSNAQTFPEVPITITRSGTTATASCTSGTHGFANGESVTISGAAQSEYNGTYTITYISATQFSYTVTVTASYPATPATGTISIAGVSVYGDTGVLLSGGGSSWIMNVATYDTGIPLVGEVINITSSAGDQLLGSATVTSVSGRSVTFSKSTSYSSLSDLINPVIYFRRILPAVSSITRSGNVVTLTTATAHGFENRNALYVSGADQTQYNGYTGPLTVTSTTAVTYELTTAESPATPATGTIKAKKPDVIATSSFTYTVAGSPTTPATGTITASSGRITVPGIAYIDGYFCVMDVQGVIYSSASDDPQTWNPLDYTTALAESGAGKAIAKSLAYVVAFKEFSTEFFYNDTSIVTGSPLRPVESGFTQIGCASGTSLALLDGSLFWMAQTRQEGRSVYVMRGTEQQKVSTPDVDRILNRDDLSEVFAYGVKLDGHPLYILTLTDSDITLAYDTASQTWSQWSSMTIGSSVAVTSITRSGTTATVTVSGGHGLNDGDPVKIAGASQSEYNGIFQAFVSSSTVFTIQVSGSPATPATGTILMYPYTESYFKFTHYAACDGQNLLLHESDGYLYEILSTQYQDNGAPINVLLRSTRIDGGSLDYKAMARAVLVGDNETGSAAIRWSDDDMQTQVVYRPVDLALDEPMIRRMGRFRRRTLEVRHVEDDPINLVAMEVETS